MVERLVPGRPHDPRIVPTPRLRECRGERDHRRRSECATTPAVHAVALTPNIAQRPLHKASTLVYDRAVQVDESGAPWPYDPPPEGSADDGKPTWACPGGICECHPPVGEAQRKPHRILFCDGEGRRMPGARCRVLENGQLLNKESPYADGSGAVSVKIRPDSRSLEVEWVPKGLPQGSWYPYQKLYYLDMGEESDEGVQRRLHNLGFSSHATLEENIRDFERTYRKLETGRAKHVEGELAEYHDKGKLPPFPPSDSKAKAPPVDAKPPPPSGSAPRGVGKAGLLTPRLKTPLRVRVRTRAGRGIKDAEVSIRLAAGVEKKGKTDEKGFVTLAIERDELDKASPSEEVVVRAWKHHHGPEPRGADKRSRGAAVTPGAIEVTVLVDPPRGFSLVQPNLRLLDPEPSTPGVEAGKPPFLDLVLRDAGMNQAQVASAVTRRMEKTEVQLELMYHHNVASVTLDPRYEFEFEHEPTPDPFAPCTTKCKLLKPGADDWVSLLTNTIAGVTWLTLYDPFVPGTLNKGERAGAELLRDKFTWKKNWAGLINLDRRHVVGLARLCGELQRSLGIVVVYTQGIEGDSGRTDCHGHGLATDFGGCSTVLPEAYNPRVDRYGSTRQAVRLGVDFIVYFHWGLWSHVPMWDPATVAANPNQESGKPPWKRFGGTSDDGYDYAKDPEGKKKKLHYRLDRPPYQDPLPDTLDPALRAEMEKLAPHFQKASALFRAVYDFAVREYTDDNTTLGPLPGVTEKPTPIDSHTGHKILCPDYPHPTTVKKPQYGRQPHNNHLHFQLGETEYGTARTK